MARNDHSGEMPNDSGGEGGPGTADAGQERRRAARPAMQIYRPGMLKTGTDITQQPRKQRDDESSMEDRSSSSARRPPKMPMHDDRVTRDNRITYRRRSSPESISGRSNVSSIRGSGDTTPEAGTPTRSYANEHKYSGGKRNQPRHYRGGSVYGEGAGRGGRRNGDSRKSSVRGSNDDVRSTGSYNSTQSLLNPRRQGGYLEYNNRSPNRGGRGDGGGQYRPQQDRRTIPSLLQNIPARNRQTFDRNGDRASMRAEEGNRRPPRRRNDSIGSTQSEMPRGSTDRQNYPDSSCAASEAGESSVGTGSLADFYSSMESFATMDWSAEMEREDRERLEREKMEKEKAAERAEQLSQRLSEISIRGDAAPPTRGVLRVNVTKQGRRRAREENGHEEEDVEEEEQEEEDEEEEGQRTPTYDGGREREESNRDWIRGIGEQMAEASQRERGPQLPTSGRLAGRVTRDAPSNSRGERKARPERGSYVPPGLRGSSTTLAVRMDSMENRVRPSADDYRTEGEAREEEEEVMDRRRGVDVRIKERRGSDDRRGKEATKGRDERDESHEKTAIKQAEDELRGVLGTLQKRKDLNKARQILLLSSRLSEMHAAMLTRDIRATFTRHGEGALFRSAFHGPITTLKCCSNSSSVEAAQFRKLLLRLIQDGLDFYARVIKSYEEALGVRLEEKLPWSEGVWPQTLDAAVTKASVLGEEESKEAKVGYLSLARHLVCIGDLYRYRSTVSGDDNYAESQKYYLQASLLLPSNGHTYNQLAVLSFYQERVLNEFFFCVRAMTASHPYEATRERFVQRAAAAIKKGEKYEGLLDKQMGRVQAEVDLSEREDRPREIWIDVDGRQERPDGRLPQALQIFAESDSSQLHRRCVSYIVYVVAMLNSKIGMERFPSAAARLFAQLKELITRDDCPLSAAQLVQLAALLIYAVHASSASSTKDEYSAHTNTTIRTVLTLLAILLEVVRKSLPQLEGLLRGDTEAQEDLLRVLPALFILSEWLSSAAAFALYAHQDRLKPLDLQLLPKLSLWSALAEVANTIERLEGEGVLARIEENVDSSDISSRAVLPESLLLASFTASFGSQPKHFSFPDGRMESPSLCALHIRLRSLFVLAEFLDGADATPVSYSVERKRFEATDTFDEEEEREERERMRRREEASLSPPPSNHHPTRRLIVVRPSFVALDTNVYVESLPLVEKILESGRFSILVPTTVLDELVGLSQGRDPAFLSGEAAPDSSHAALVTSQSRTAVSWMKDRAREKHQKMGVLTTKGVRLAFAMLNEDAEPLGSKVNDDRILEACALFADCLPPPPLSKLPKELDSENPIHRAVVLITDDRGMNIKANARNIPVRTIHSFLQWAKIGNKGSAV